MNGRKVNTKGQILPSGISLLGKFLLNGQKMTWGGHMNYSDFGRKAIKYKYLKNKFRREKDEKNIGSYC